MFGVFVNSCSVLVISIIYFSYFNYLHMRKIQKPPEVITPLGPVTGYLQKSFEGRTFSAFEGIPFAKPPVGPLRFSDPIPIEPWSNPINATKTCVCTQESLNEKGKIIGQEDCLYLNVYVPRTTINSKDQLNVLVNIHGGAFSIGSGTMFASPDYLMDREIILVTMNYRLSLMGFLSTNDNVISGNFGLKDQNLALKWVQQNIASFGGNPNSVTLSGQSAGAASVHLHYFSPMSKGLFHRGLSQSGSALNFWAVSNHSLEKAQRLAVLSNCPDKNTTELANCLREQPADELILKTVAFEEFYSWKSVPFAPVIEKGLNGFLTESPFELLKRKEVFDVPWVTSTMQEEGLYFVMPIIRNLNELNERWQEIAQIIACYNYTLPKDSWSDTADALKEFYFKDQNINLHLLSKLITDRWFIMGAESSVKYQTVAITSPIYYYNFNYEGTHSFTQLITKNDSVFGTTHCDDSLYMFTSNFLNSNLALSEEDIKMKDLFLDFIMKYAETGIPKFGSTNWESVRIDKFSYLNVTSTTDIKLQTAKELFFRELWQKLGLLDKYN